MTTDELDDWCDGLAELCVGRGNLATAKQRLRSYLPMLTKRLPPDAFTTDSLERCAAKLRSLPSYGELLTVLEAWWNEHGGITPTTTTTRDKPTDPDGRPTHHATQQVIDAYYVADWDNPDGIDNLVRRLRDDAAPSFKIPLFNALRSAVGQWAPQHLHLVPPDVADILSPDERERAFARRYVPDDERPEPRYLTPEQLDEFNPLPSGPRRPESDP